MKIGMEKSTTEEKNEVIKPDLSKVAIKKANQAVIPANGIINSKIDPNLVTFLTPANST